MPRMSDDAACHIREMTVSQERAQAPARILSICCLYPNPVHPGQGLFVQRRLQHLAEIAEVIGPAKGKLVWEYFHPVTSG